MLWSCLYLVLRQLFQLVVLLGRSQHSKELEILLLRTSRRAIYAMVERNQLPGVARIGRRVLVRRADLIDWLDQKSALSLKEYKR